MVLGFTPFKAVFWSTLAAVGISFLMSYQWWLTPRRLSGALIDGGKDVLPVLATTAVAGVIVGRALYTGAVPLADALAAARGA